MLYVGFLINIHECFECHYNIYFLERFTDITLKTTFYKEKEFNIEELLNEFFSDEIFNEDKSTCINCEKPRIGVIKKKIIFLPKILTIYIDRGNIDLLKEDERNICYFELLDFSKCKFNLSFRLF